MGHASFSSRPMYQKALLLLYSNSAIAHWAQKDTLTRNMDILSWPTTAFGRTELWPDLEKSTALGCIYLDLLLQTACQRWLKGFETQEKASFERISNRINKMREPGTTRESCIKMQRLIYKLSLLSEDPLQGCAWSQALLPSPALRRPCVPLCELVFPLPCCLASAVRRYCLQPQALSVTDANGLIKAKALPTHCF